MCYNKTYDIFAEVSSFDSFLIIRGGDGFVAGHFLGLITSSVDGAIIFCSLSSGFSHILIDLCEIKPFLCLPFFGDLLLRDFFDEDDGVRLFSKVTLPNLLESVVFLQCQ